MPALRPAVVGAGVVRIVAGDRRRAQCFFHRHLHGMELVVSGHLLDHRSAAIILEDDEIPDHGEEGFRRKQPLGKRLELWGGGLDVGVHPQDAPGLNHSCLR